MLVVLLQILYIDDNGKIEVYKLNYLQDPSIGMMEGINAICDKLNIKHEEIDVNFPRNNN